MTPAARVQTAASLLDEIAAGRPAEQVLTTWARRARYAGSGDRAAVRDHVFDVLRQRRSCAARGGGESGRALMLGLLRAQGADPDTLFTGAPHAPAPLEPRERAAGRSPDAADLRDLPDWLWHELQDGLGARAAGTAEALRHRAPVHLRANLLRTTREGAQAALAAEGIRTIPAAAATTALEVTEGARRVAGSAAFRDGLVELQDAASQAVAEWLSPVRGARILDYCAGGGGKALALAALVRGPVAAHDIDARRMKDLPARAARAGAEVRLVAPGTAPVYSAGGGHDLVLCDAPCSGSGAWRRAPEAKWRLTPEGLERLTQVQDEVLDAAAPLVAPGGRLAYVTCSVLARENEARCDAFLRRHPGWRLAAQRQWLPGPEGDGFFAAQLTRES